MGLGQKPPLHSLADLSLFTAQVLTRFAWPGACSRFALGEVFRGLKTSGRLCSLLASQRSRTDPCGVVPGGGARSPRPSAPAHQSPSPSPLVSLEPSRCSASSRHGHGGEGSGVYVFSGRDLLSYISPQHRVKVTPLERPPCETRILNTFVDAKASLDFAVPSQAKMEGERGELST